MSAHLFDPIQLESLKLRNRIIIAPMCQYSATDEGTATDWHTIHLGHLALSGAGLLVIEATAVEADGRISPRDLGLWSDDNERGLARVLESVRANSSMPIGIQLAHAGRKTSHRVPWEGSSQIKVSEGGWTAHAPSALAFAPDGEAPRALDRAGLARVKAAFRKAAERSVRIGVDAIEIHSAHGYLLHEFLSPLSNKRDDEYGGALANRLRFPLEVFDAMREVVPPHIPLGLRYSATDYYEGGWDLEQTLAYSQELKKRGCSFFDVSSGGLTPAQKLALAPGYQVPFAEAVKRETKRSDDGRRPHHRSRAGRADRRVGTSRHGRARTRHPLRRSLAVARGGEAWRQGAWTEAVSACAAGCREGPVPSGGGRLTA